MATEEVSKGRRVVLSIPVQNPAPVFDSQGKMLGCAFIEGMVVELHLDRNRPETLDLEVHPETLKATVHIFSYETDDTGAAEQLELKIILEGP